jgi:hypothetical protein
VKKLQELGRAVWIRAATRSYRQRSGEEALPGFDDLIERCCSDGRDALPPRPASLVQRKVQMSETSKLAKRSLTPKAQERVCRAARRSVETCCGGRAGAHPYRRRRRNSWSYHFSDAYQWRPFVSSFLERFLDRSDAATPELLTSLPGRPFKSILPRGFFLIRP